MTMQEHTIVEETIEDLKRALKLIEDSEDQLSRVYGAGNKYSLDLETTTHNLNTNIYMLTREIEK